MESKLVYVVHLPVNYNDGTEIPQFLRDAFRRWALTRAGGYTELGQVTGAWFNEDTGETIVEPIDRLEIALPADADITTYAELVGFHARQYSIYVKYPAGFARFIDTSASVDLPLIREINDLKLVPGRTPVEVA